jgi:hypothetical protein
VRGYYYFCRPGTPHYPDWHFFGSRNWHKGDGTPDPLFGETSGSRQTWRNGSFATTFPDARRVGDQGCIELGTGRHSPPTSLIAGVDARCWEVRPPWGGLALGGSGTFEVVMPLPVGTLQTPGIIPIPAPGTVIMSFAGFNGRIDATLSSDFVQTIFLTPLDRRLYRVTAAFSFAAHPVAAVAGSDSVVLKVVDALTNNGWAESQASFVVNPLHTQQVLGNAYVELNTTIVLDPAVWPAGLALVLQAGSTVAGDITLLENPFGGFVDVAVFTVEDLGPVL